MGQLVVIVAMFALLWLLLIRPQAKRKLAQQRLLSSVEVGDEILTAGGLYGHVRALGDADELEVEIAPGTQVRIARRAVAAVIPPDDESEAIEGEFVGEESPDAAEATTPADANRG